VLTLASESLEVEVLPDLGARLHRLHAFGQDVLVIPPDLATYEREPFLWGCYPMAPWCNRVSTERLLLGTRAVALSPNFSDGSAIHGQVYRSAWQTDDGLSDAAGTFRVLAGGDEWPWEYEVSQAITVRGSTLVVELTLSNRSTDPMPGGLGLHPWFGAPIELAIPADAVYPSNLESAALPEPVGGDLDLRARRPMPAGLDATWTTLSAPVVELGWPQLGIQASMRLSADTPHVVAASPADRAAVAVEPQTHAPQGLRRLLNGEPGAMTWLAPGAALHLGVEIAFDQASRAAST
jgi:aldose 1-epimerase